MTTAKNVACRVGHRKKSNSVISRMWARTCLIVIASTLGCVVQTQYLYEQKNNTEQNVSAKKESKGTNYKHQFESLYFNLWHFMRQKKTVDTLK